MMSKSNQELKVIQVFLCFSQDTVGLTKEKFSFNNKYLFDLQVHTNIKIPREGDFDIEQILQTHNPLKKDDYLNLKKECKLKNEYMHAIGDAEQRVDFFNALRQVYRVCEQMMTVNADSFQIKINTNFSWQGKKTTDQVDISAERVVEKWNLQQLGYFILSISPSFYSLRDQSYFSRDQAK